MSLLAPLGRRFLKPILSQTVSFSQALCFAQHTKIVQKKQKFAAEEPEPRSPPVAALSPQQLERIARNKKAALERLASSQIPAGFGESWRKDLSAEFGKPYFKQVRGPGGTLHTLFLLHDKRFNDFASLPQLMEFVCGERKRHTVYPPDEHVFTWTQMCDIRDVSLVAWPDFSMGYEI